MTYVVTYPSRWTLAPLIEAAAEAVAQEVDPLDDFRGPADYKRDMAVVFTRRALTQVLANGAVQ